MDATRFEFQLSVPRDAEVAAIVRMLAEQAARYAGCDVSSAAAFGQQVAEAVRAQLNGSHSHTTIPVIVRRTTGPLEVLVENCTVALEI